MTSNSNEVFPLVDRDGRVVGEATRYECHHRTAANNHSFLLHPVIHLHVFSRDGRRVLLQKRSMTKDLYPGRWDTSVGGHLDRGETALAAVLRETREELGLDLAPLCAAAPPAAFFCAGQHLVQSPYERELVYVYAAVAPDEAAVVAGFERHAREDTGSGTGEVAAVRFWDLADEVVPALGSGVFTLHFEVDYYTYLYKGLRGLLREQQQERPVAACPHYLLPHL